MFFLLPPSESKQAGGKAKSSKLSFSELDACRDLVKSKLLAVSKNPKEAAKALKLGPTQLGELAVNLELTNPQVMPAIDRYTGVLFDALKQDGLSKSELLQAKNTVFIQSSLFGLISALDEIPNYRLSAGAKLPGLNLKKAWSDAHQGIWAKFNSEIVIDLRSKAYSALAPIPKDLESYEVEVVSEDSSGQRKALNHFNKKAKGQLVRQVLVAKTKPSKLKDLSLIAKQAGLAIEVQGRTLLLITNS
jgi:uncharacterized protein